MNNNLVDSKLESFLNLYWLRPENGLITTFKSLAFESFKFESPSLDLSCGDGMFMAIHLGGLFDSDFDYFKSTKANEFNHSNVIDIYDISLLFYPLLDRSGILCVRIFFDTLCKDLLPRLEGDRIRGDRRRAGDGHGGSDTRK